MGALKRGVAALAVVCCAAGPASQWARAAAADPAAELLEAAKKAFDGRRYGRATSLAKRVARRYPASPAAEEAMLVRIDAEFERGKLPRAYQTCEEMLQAYPRSKHRTAVLRRELKIGDALTRQQARVLLFRLSRLDEGVNVLKSVIEHAPFGPLADDAVLAIADAYLGAGKHEEARDYYDRLLRDYPTSELALRARVSQALCDYRMSDKAPHDVAPAERARRELAVLSRVSDDQTMTRRMAEMRDLLARSDYDTGLFYVRRGNVEGAARYMKAVASKYPKSEYAGRAKRILEAIRAAQAEEKP